MVWIENIAQTAPIEPRSPLDFIIKKSDISYLNTQYYIYKLHAKPWLVCPLTSFYISLYPSLSLSHIIIVSTIVRVVMQVDEKLNNKLNIHRWSSNAVEDLKTLSVGYWVLFVGNGDGRSQSLDVVRDFAWGGVANRQCTFFHFSSWLVANWRCYLSPIFSVVTCGQFYR